MEQAVVNPWSCKEPVKESGLHVATGVSSQSALGFGKTNSSRNNKPTSPEGEVNYCSAEIQLYDTAETW